MLKEITGFSNLIDSNMIKWNGGSSQVPFFSEEVCAIELTFENEIDTIRDTITIVSTKTMIMVYGLRILKMVSF